MGCISSKDAKKEFKRSPWKSQEPVSRSALQKLRDEFWDTAPHYGGDRGEYSLARERIRLLVAALDFDARSTDTRLPRFPQSFGTH